MFSVFEEAQKDGSSMEAVSSPSNKEHARLYDASLSSFTPRVITGRDFPEVDKLTLNLLDFANLRR